MLEDVARALRYLKDRASTRPDQDKRIMLVGHSAGAQLCAQLLLQPSYLQAVGMASKDIDAVALLCGPLDLPYMMEVHLGLSARVFMRHMAMRPAFGPEAAWPAWSPALLRHPEDCAMESVEMQEGMQKGLKRVNVGPRWMILTGTTDSMVSPHGSDELAKTLEKAGCS